MTSEQAETYSAVTNFKGFGDKSENGCMVDGKQNQTNSNALHTLLSLYSRDWDVVYLL